MQDKAKKKQVLLIDDDPTLLMTLQSMLRTQFEVTTALGGELALHALNEQGLIFDAIICDLNMPNMNGIEVYAEILKRYPGQEKKIIFMSGGAYTLPMEEFMAITENPVLEKPFSIGELLNTVKNTVTQ